MAQPLPQTLYSCAGISRDADRLACYDREIAALTHNSAIPAGGDSTAGPAVAAAVAASAPPARVGVEAPKTAPAAGSTAVSTAAVPSPMPVLASAPAGAATQVAAGAVAGAGTAAAAGAAAGTATGSAGVTTTLTPEQAFGLTPDKVRKLEAKQGIQPNEVKTMSAHITDVSRGASGRQVFKLDNGQVWRQSETRARFEAVPGEAVTISHGAMGSFWLATNNHNWTRVERVP